MFSGQSGGQLGDRRRSSPASIAGEGASESNVDPLDRAAIEQLARVAELQVAEVTGRPIDEPGAPRAAQPGPVGHAASSTTSGRCWNASRARSVRRCRRSSASWTPTATGWPTWACPRCPGMPPEAMLRQMMGDDGADAARHDGRQHRRAPRDHGRWATTSFPLPRPSSGPLTHGAVQRRRVRGRLEPAPRRHPAVGLPVGRGTPPGAVASRTCARTSTTCSRSTCPPFCEDPREIERAHRRARHRRPRRRVRAGARGAATAGRQPRGAAGRDAVRRTACAHAPARGRRRHRRGLRRLGAGPASVHA